MSIFWRMAQVSKLPMFLFVFSVIPWQETSFCLFENNSERSENIGCFWRVWKKIMDRLQHHQQYIFRACVSVNLLYSSEKWSVSCMNLRHLERFHKKRPVIEYSMWKCTEILSIAVCTSIVFNYEQSNVEDRKNVCIWKKKEVSNGCSMVNC